MRYSVVGAPALRRATAERISFFSAKMGLDAQMGEQQPRDCLGRLVGDEVAHPRYDLEAEGAGDEIGGEPGPRGPRGGVAVPPTHERRHPLPAPPPPAPRS